MPSAHGKKADNSRGEVEIEPGAWERFEKAVDGALHTKPKRQDEMKVGKRKAAKARNTKGK